MDARTVARRRRLAFGSAIGGVVLMTVGTSAVFAGAPTAGIALVGTSLFLMVGAVATLLR